MLGNWVRWRGPGLGVLLTDPAGACPINSKEPGRAFSFGLLYWYTFMMKKNQPLQPNYPSVGIYEHYKSTPTNRRYYQVLGFARHTETEEIVAVYVPLYVIPEHTGLRLQVRPLDMFMEKVEVDGVMVPRFLFIGTEL